MMLSNQMSHYICKCIRIVLFYLERYKYLETSCPFFLIIVLFAYVFVGKKVLPQHFINYDLVCVPISTYVHTSLQYFSVKARYHSLGLLLWLHQLQEVFESNFKRRVTAEFFLVSEA